DLRRRLAGIEQLLHDAALLNLALDRVAVEHMQGLRERGLRLGFAGTDRVAWGTAEGRQEVVARRAVGNFDRSSTQRQTLELVADAGHLADAVEQLLGRNPADIGVGEVPLVEFVRRIASGRALIGVRRADVANELPEVVLVFDQLLTESL